MMKLKPTTEKDEKQEREFVMVCLAVTCGAGTLAEALRLLLAVMDWTDGTLTGYAGGTERKARLLALEGICLP